MKMSFQQRIFLEHNILTIFFRTFAILVRFGGGRRSKNHQKLVKSGPVRVKSDPGGSLGPLRDMAQTFEAIWKHFSMI